MRPQYHLHSSPKGLPNRDMRKLIALASELKIQPHWVALSETAELDQHHWFSDPGDEPCRERLPSI